MRRSYTGFTLIELLVVATIISILAGAGFFYARDAAEKSRDNKRQADLKLLQAAVEQYKIDNGRYPEGCNGPGNWSAELGAGEGYACPNNNTQYIVGLAPTYIPVLPRDPKRDSGEIGYAYTVNAAGTVYKIVARGTVESETVTISHPLKSCDMTTDTQTNDPLDGGWCTILCDDADCNQSTNSNGNGSQMIHACNTSGQTFKTSYGVWGGFAPLRATPSDSALCQGNRCVNDRAENPLRTFVNTSGSPLTNVPAPIQRLLRMRAISGTTEITCM